VGSIGALVSVGVGVAITWVFRHDIRRIQARNRARSLVDHPIQTTPGLLLGADPEHAGGSPRWQSCWRTGANVPAIQALFTTSSVNISLSVGGGLTALLTVYSLIT
jgi:hypothetical protein